LRLATHTTPAPLTAAIGLTVGPMALAALTLLMATIGLTVELAAHAAPALLLAALGLTVGLATRVAPALLMVTFGLAVGLAARVALALLMAAPGLTVGLATRVALALLMATPGLAVGMATLATLATLMATSGPTVALAALATATSAKTCLLTMRPAAHAAPTSPVAALRHMGAKTLTRCPTPSSTRCWAASGSHRDGATGGCTTLAQCTCLQARLECRRRPFILQPLCVLLPTPSRRHLKIPSTSDDLGCQPNKRQGTVKVTSWHLITTLLA